MNNQNADAILAHLELILAALHGAQYVHNFDNDGELASLIAVWHGGRTVNIVCKFSGKHVDCFTVAAPRAASVALDNIKTAVAAYELAGDQNEGTPRY